MFKKISGVTDWRMVFNTVLTLLVTFQTIYASILPNYANDILLRTLAFGTLAINIVWSKRESIVSAVSKNNADLENKGK